MAQITNSSFTDMLATFLSGYSNGGTFYIDAENVASFTVLFEDCSFENIYAGNEGGILYATPLRENANVTFHNIKATNIYAPFGTFVSQLMQNLETIVTTYIFANISFF